MQIDKNGFAVRTENGIQTYASLPTLLSSYAASFSLPVAHAFDTATKYFSFSFP